MGFESRQSVEWSEDLEKIWKRFEEDLKKIWRRFSTCLSRSRNCRRVRGNIFSVTSQNQRVSKSNYKICYSYVLVTRWQWVNWGTNKIFFHCVRKIILKLLTAFVSIFVMVSIRVETPLIWINAWRIPSHLWFEPRTLTPHRGIISALNVDPTSSVVISMSFQYQFYLPNVQMLLNLS